jgi:hypothetical protein
MVAIEQNQVGLLKKLFGVKMSDIKLSDKNKLVEKKKAIFTNLI